MKKQEPSDAGYGVWRKLVDDARRGKKGPFSEGVLRAAHGWPG
jgi:hypothetical protein